MIVANPVRTKGGFSLIEVVAALFIFSAGILACLELYAVSLRSSANSTDYTVAAFLAQQVMEEKLAEGYLVASTDSGEFGDSHPRHSWEVEISDTDQDATVQVSVIVNWNERGVDKDFTLTTLHSDPTITRTEE